MVTKGLVPKTSTYNVLIEDFAKVGKMDQARELLNEMQVRRVPPNSSTYDILICGWCNLSKQPELDRISKKTYRTEARTLFAEMNEKGFVPCENTLACISSTFARPGMVVDAKHMLKDMYKRKQS
jgi:pentatricopeptide repeat protein